MSHFDTGMARSLPECHPPPWPRKEEAPRQRRPDSRTDFVSECTSCPASVQVVLSKANLCAAFNANALSFRAAERIARLLRRDRAWKAS